MILSGDFLCKADRYASIEKGDLYPVFIFERGNIPEHRHEILPGAGRGRQHQRRCPAAVRHPAGLLRTDEAAGSRLRRGAGPLHLPSAAPEPMQSAASSGHVPFRKPHRTVFMESFLFGQSKLCTPVQQFLLRKNRCAPVPVGAWVQDLRIDLP